MATSPLTRSARALTVGLALVGAVCAGAASMNGAAASAAFAGVIAVEEPGPPPPPDPTLGAQPPADPGTPQVGTRPHRRHIDGDPVMRR
ncbi:hypothetical protein [Mycobacterium paraterrae]|uniref:Uncharacterized protein n=1 Tax=Mycobacterium paraterrae TaxID=577492 RepID=A0ABY3VK71_9MYCO|nr:hypothetical protein [Mycobacterium paraterrae]UMB67636.1 hypothetical protein MKK62_14050 [Mycobacterium paraterrae]